MSSDKQNTVKLKKNTTKLSLEVKQNSNIKYYIGAMCARLQNYSKLTMILNS